MIFITVPAFEYYDEAKGTFGNTKETTLLLEHSLISISKWESKWNKPFLGKANKTVEQCIDYVRCMTLNKGVDPAVYYGLTNDMFDKINRYIDLPMTATWFSDKEENKKISREVITAEIIYYWMISLNIPVEFDKWHLNRLLTLVRVCNIKNAPPKKRSKSEIYERNRALNASRRAKYNSRG